MENIGAIYYYILIAIIVFCILVVIAFVLAKKFPFLANICLLCHAMLLLPFATILSKMFSPLSFENSISMVFLLIFLVIIPQVIFFIYTKINKDINISDTNKTLGDLVTNITDLQNNKQNKFVTGGAPLRLAGNSSYLIAVKVFSTVSSAGALGLVLGGYDIHWIYNSQVSVSRSGSNYTFSSGYGTPIVSAIPLG